MEIYPGLEQRRLVSLFGAHCWLRIPVLDYLALKPPSFFASIREKRESKLIQDLAVPSEFEVSLNYG